MALMAQKLEASLALEGQFSVEGLAAMSADSGSLTMELAKSLVENLDFGDADRVWEHFHCKRARPSGALPEAGDEVCGPGDDACHRLKSAPGRIHEQGLLFLPPAGVGMQLHLFPELRNTGDDIHDDRVRIPRHSHHVRRYRCRR